MEFCEYGSLADVMKIRSKAFSESQVAYIMRRTIQALDYLAQNNKVHRDIKPANIMLCGNGKVKLGDLGITKDLKPDGTLRDRIGSVLYLAPEIARDTPYNCKVDVWSLGISAVELLVGRAPRSSDRTKEILRQLVTEPQGPSLQHLPRHFSPLLRNFLNRCLQVDPSKRPTAAELLNDPFILRASSASLKPIIDEMRSVVSLAGSFQSALAVSSNCRIEQATADDTIEEEDLELAMHRIVITRGDDSNELVDAVLVDGMPNLIPISSIHQHKSHLQHLSHHHLHQHHHHQQQNICDRVLILPPSLAPADASGFSYLRHGQQSGEDDDLSSCSFESEGEIHALVSRPIVDSPIWARPGNEVLQHSGFALDAPAASNNATAQPAQ